MKTLKNSKQTFKAIMLTVMFIALILPAANAQRRTGTTGNEKSKKIVRKGNSKAHRPSEKSGAYKKNDHNYRAKQDFQKKDDKGYRTEKNFNKKGKGNGNHQNKDWYGKHYPDKKSDQRNKQIDRHFYNKNIQVHLKPRIYSHWDTHRNHIAFRRIPRMAVWVHLDGISYIKHQGRFYQSGPFGYFRVYLPSYIQYLPEGSQEVWVNGHQLYHLHGILFLNTPLGFKVIL